MKYFPNGFTSWQETHFEVVSEITKNLRVDKPTGLVFKTMMEKGTGGLYELAEELTDEFELLNEGREWDGEFFDEIEEFLTEKLK
jgi:hypothetical protein